MTISVRELRKDEFATLAEFLAANALPRFSVQEYLVNFDFWWLRNPYFRSDDPYGWVIADDSRRDYLQGFLGSIPADYRYADKQFTTVSPTTWYVAPDYRKHSLYLFFAFYRQKKDIMVTSTASDMVSEISLKFGCINMSGEQKTLMRPLSHRIVAYAAAKKNLKLPFLPVSLFSRACFVLFRLYEEILCFTRLNSRRYKAAEVFDAVSVRELQQASSNVYVEDMTWILQNDSNKRLMGVYEEGQDVMKGYLLVQFVRNRHNGLNYVQVLDSLNITLPIMDSIGGSILKLFPREEIDCIVFSNCSFGRHHRYGYMDITRLMPSTCLVYGDRVSEIKGATITGVFGEKGFILWHA